MEYRQSKIITPYHIKVFQHCPREAQKLWDKQSIYWGDKPSLHFSLFTETVKLLATQRYKRNTTVDWKYSKRILNSLIRKHQENIKQLKKPLDISRILELLHYWFYNIFSGRFRLFTFITDVKIDIEYEHYIIQDIVPMIGKSPEGHIYVIDFEEDDQPKRKLNDSMDVISRVWCVYYYSNKTLPIYYTKMLLCKRMIKQMNIYFNHVDQLQEENIDTILYSMYEGANYCTCRR